MSEEYAQVKASYDDKCAKIIKKIKEYPQNVDDLLSSVLENTARKEYSAGTEGLILGYYHPSPVYDLVVGGVRRGRLLKKPSTKYALTHQYHFDSREKLTFAAPLLSNMPDTFSDRVQEYYFVFDDVDTRLVLCKMKSGDIYNALYCIYKEGRIIDYNSISLMNYYEDNATYAAFLDHEEYSYIEGQLAVVNRYAYIPDHQKKEKDNVAVIPNTSTLRNRRYEFQHDEKGYLDTYKYSEYLGETLIQSNSYSNKIKEKRKV